MRPNPTKEKLRRGELAVGMMTLTAEPHVVGLIAAAGYDFIMFDLEHTSLTYERLERLVHAADAAGITPMTRVSSGSRSDILRALETGVRGLMVPMVESAAAAAEAARFARYHPHGERGVYFLSYPSGYGGGTLTEHAAATNDALLLIAQVESAAGAENAAAIAAVPGIDMLFIGPADLSQSLGVPGQLGHERVVQATEAILGAARAAGKWSGVMGLDPENAARWAAQGATFIVWHQEMTLFKRVLAQEAAAAQSRLGWQPRGGQGVQ
jgi:2-keto-3-deoxy-L-rhamnonate aldolase RhmA